jgi:hypothetical protein
MTIINGRNPGDSAVFRQKLLRGDTGSVPPQSVEVPLSAESGEATEAERAALITTINGRNPGDSAVFRPILMRGDIGSVSVQSVAVPLSAEKGEATEAERAGPITTINGRNLPDSAVIRVILLILTGDTRSVPPQTVVVVSLFRPLSAEKEEAAEAGRAGPMNTINGRNLSDSAVFRPILLIQTADTGSVPPQWIVVVSLFPPLSAENGDAKNPREPAPQPTIKIRLLRLCFPFSGVPLSFRSQIADMGQFSRSGRLFSASTR